MKQTKKILSTTGQPLLSARAAAEMLSCAPDYIGKLCREGKLAGTRHKKVWLVDPDSIAVFEKSRTESKLERSKELSEIRKQENRVFQRANPLANKSLFASLIHPSAGAVLASLAVGAAVFVGSALFSGAAYQGQPLGAALGQLDSPFFGTGTQLSLKDIGSSVTKLFAGWFAQKPIAAVEAPAPVAAASTPPVLSATSTPQKTNPISATVVQNTYPIRERVVERVVVQTGVTQDLLVSQLQQLGNALRTELYGSINGLSSVAPAQGGISGAIAISQNISKLSNVTITNGTVNGLSGLTSSDIPALNYFPATTSVGAVYGGTGLTAYTTGDLLYASAANTLSVLPIGAAGKVLKISDGVPVWGTDNSGSGGSSAFATTSDNLAIVEADPTQVVIVGATATTTTGNIFEVSGNSLFRNALTAYGTLTAPRFVATTSVASTFPYASSTALSVSGTGY